MSHDKNPCRFAGIGVLALAAALAWTPWASAGADYNFERECVISLIVTTYSGAAPAGGQETGTSTPFFSMYYPSTAGESQSVVNTWCQDMIRFNGETHCLASMDGSTSNSCTYAAEYPESSGANKRYCQYLGQGNPSYNCGARQWSYAEVDNPGTMTYAASTLSGDDYVIVEEEFTLNWTTVSGSGVTYTLQRQIGAPWDFSTAHTLYSGSNLTFTGSPGLVGTKLFRIRACTSSNICSISNVHELTVENE